ncbi:hypothetical protein MIS46_03370 [Wielerella bovis]|uniref:DUF6988 family protein n=1 Tax=Wielerella bovis TaxID=2917790 RepID=UPI0020196AE4|nr:hypothetical protein [Wielerella bovis]ULJ63108.1 hypothetical protein MIS46_03370 [Wielerella bovis]
MTPILKQFLAKSIDFRAAMFREIKEIPFTDETEYQILATLIMADISSEYWEAIHALAYAESFIPAVSLLRLQYESLLRAYWLYYCAKNERISELHQPLDEKNVRSIENHMPNVKEMLVDLDKAVIAGKLHPKSVQMFQEFREMHNQPANSFVHSGMHAFNRQREGFIEPMFIQIVQNANGLEALNAMLQGLLCDSEGWLSLYIVRLQHQYLDCLPMQIENIVQQFYRENAPPL